MNKRQINRREFFRRTGKGLLPILSLSSISLFLSACDKDEDDSDCHNACASTCSKTCSGTCEGLCAVGCYGICSASSK